MAGTRGLEPASDRERPRLTDRTCLITSTAVVEECRIGSWGPIGVGSGHVVSGWRWVCASWSITWSSELLASPRRRVGPGAGRRRFDRFRQLRRRGPFEARPGTSLRSSLCCRREPAAPSASAETAVRLARVHRTALDTRLPFAESAHHAGNRFGPLDVLGARHCIGDASIVRIRTTANGRRCWCSSTGTHDSPGRAMLPL